MIFRYTLVYQTLRISSVLTFLYVVKNVRFGFKFHIMFSKGLPDTPLNIFFNWVKSDNFLLRTNKWVSIDSIHEIILKVKSILELSHL